MLRLDLTVLRLPSYYTPKLHRLSIGLRAQAKPKTKWVKRLEADVLEAGDGAEDGFMVCKMSLMEEDYLRFKLQWRAMCL